MKNLSIAIAALLTGCVVAPPARVYLPPDQGVIYDEPAPQPVISVYVDPPLYQPPPVRVQWAPPPMLVEFVPQQPYPDAFWIGGYWVWEGNWVWAHGRWASRPRPGYGWVNPYYEHRGDSVVFISGFWAAPGVVFERPSPSINIAFATVIPAFVPGRAPVALPPAQTSASPATHPRNQGSEPVRGQPQGQSQEPSQEQDRRIRAEQRAATMRNMPQPQQHPQPQLQPQLQQHAVVPLRENVQAPPRPVQRPNAEPEKSREANQPKEEKRLERKSSEHE